MGAINRVPRGLLPLLDAKTMGQTPPDLASVVQPTLELFELYAADIPFEVTAATDTSTPVAGGLLAPVTVPAGEVWLVYGASGRCVHTENGTQVLVLSLDLSSDNSAIIFLTSGVFGFTQPGTIGDPRSTTYNPDKPLLVSAGSSFETSYETTTSTINLTTTTTVWHRTLRI